MTTSSLFVGREAVMSLLGAALSRAADGQGATLVIRGDAGIGKSRVTHELEAAGERGRHANVARRMLPR